MKKNNILLCALFCTNINIQPQVKLEPFKPKSDTPELSFYQDFQLDYISTELNQHSKTIAGTWTKDENTRILIERTELAVQESSKDTQDFMKKRIIQLFKDYGIDIFFTSDNLIQRVTQERVTHSITHPRKPHGVHIAHEDDDNSHLSATSHYHFHSLPGHDDQIDKDDTVQDHIEEVDFKKKTSRKTHKKTDTTQTVMTPAQLHRIHGGRRTLNKIKRKWAETEKELQAERDKLLQQNKFEKTVPSKGASIQPRIEPRQQHLNQERLNQERLKQEHTIDSQPKSGTHEVLGRIAFP
ncbi:MAG: hypothetical protein NTZ68_00175 [Candidatus Dependentiae bacterium]|nr:hypothetical protein [Candidatus Dependentiae bacterium]